MDDPCLIFTLSIHYQEASTILVCIKNALANPCETLCWSLRRRANAEQRRMQKQRRMPKRRRQDERQGRSRDETRRAELREEQRRGKCRAERRAEAPRRRAEARRKGAEAQKPKTGRVSCNRKKRKNMSGAPAGSATPCI